MSQTYLFQLPHLLIQHFNLSQQVSITLWNLYIFLLNNRMLLCQLSILLFNYLLAHFNFIILYLVRVEFLHHLTKFSFHFYFLHFFTVHLFIYNIFFKFIFLDLLKKMFCVLTYLIDVLVKFFNTIFLKFILLLKWWMFTK